MVADEKKQLEIEAANMHRGTKASSHLLENAHLNLREKHEWYKKWHSLRFTNFFHVFVALVLISLLAFYIYGAFSDINKASKLPKISAVAAGVVLNDDVKLNVSHKSNIKINDDNSIEIEDKSVKIGFINYKISTDNLAEWKNVSWGVNIPKEGSVVYRIKTTKGSQQDLENTEWSDYYAISGYETSTKGIPNIKSRILEVEVVIQAAEGESPKLKYLSFGYTPFNENEFLVKVRDGFFSWIKNALNFLNKKEGLYSK